ncbi:hypothetical protein B5C09_02750 [Staphylococcus delphini]|nr:hypothetical protein B5C09_02750 [Staphylococcus delphini]PCF76453.1 hypothetical protein B4W71_00580 [Staphylococcus delphini]
MYFSVFSVSFLARETELNLKTKVFMLVIFKCDVTYIDMLFYSVFKKDEIAIFVIKRGIGVNRIIC